MDISQFTANNFSNCTLKSAVPETCKNEPCLLGIDEAGRGPVLGPMVYGICYCPISNKEKLQEMKFADSKTLSEQAREKLFQGLDACNDTLGWMLQVLSPNVISNSMLRKNKYNLNALSHDSAMYLVQCAIDAGVQVAEVYVDTVGDPDKYQKKLESRFPGVNVTVSKKADSLFPVVSAASIVAKVARDEALRQWQFPEGIQTMKWGSGYPNDPDTKKFLTKNCDKVFGFPQIVRFGWSTAEKFLDKCYPVEWEEVKDEEDNTQTSVLTYFSRSQAQKPEEKMHRFFKESHLKRVVEF